MGLEPGTRLNHYAIAASIGVGGMGEVYRARDEKLGREVAIKVLPAAMASDPERLARFKREAQLLASLNHANIAQVYALEAARLFDGCGLEAFAAAENLLDADIVVGRTPVQKLGAPRVIRAGVRFRTGVSGR